MMNSWLDRQEVGNLVNSVNCRCNQNTNPRILVSQYSHITMEELLSRVSSGDKIWGLSSQDVIKIDENLVVKCGLLTLEALEEAANIQMIRELTSVPVLEIIEK